MYPELLQYLHLWVQNSTLTKGVQVCTLNFHVHVLHPWKHICTQRGGGGKDNRCRCAPSAGHRPMGENFHPKRCKTWLFTPSWVQTCFLGYKIAPLPVLVLLILGCEYVPLFLSVLYSTSLWYHNVFMIGLIIICMLWKKMIKHFPECVAAVSQWCNHVYESWRRVFFKLH